MRPHTAGIIIIGNEILSGKVQDDNSYFLARELRALGVDLRRVVVIPDDVDLIADEVRWFAGTFDYVFTSGGIGPTHDDVTMDGVAAAFGVELVSNPLLERIVKKWCEAGHEERAMKMALIPHGAEVLSEKGVKFPAIRIENVFIFPGIPEYLSTKFSAIMERFRAAPFKLNRVFINEEECYITGHLDRVVSEFPRVMIGSYPQIKGDGHKVIVTLESADESELARATDRLIVLLPQGVVTHTE